jgi:hypothetical protein
MKLVNAYPPGGYERPPSRPFNVLHVAYCSAKRVHEHGHCLNCTFMLTTSSQGRAHSSHLVLLLQCSCVRHYLNYLNSCLTHSLVVICANPHTQTTSASQLRCTQLLSASSLSDAVAMHLCDCCARPAIMAAESNVLTARQVHLHSCISAPTIVCRPV